jgi:hypothetical protein
MEFGGTTTPIWMSTPVIVLFVFGICALLYGYWCWIMAYDASSGHEPFDRLGARKWLSGYAAMNHMPDEAMVYVKRHFACMLAFFLSALAIVVIIAMDVSR